ncbi:DUF4157 domain-containing protein [Cupriavidus sp. UYPR2.512]|uniref:eCIS core domain-containing protein n=1 Tax=Cupriavidus sp. UYPR2.512 TaxID=1080187 RepID=UPI000362DDE6|nr:DUF4157 domain-containing protein [Cupriavidus sp. UYPR2.512]
MRRKPRSQSLLHDSPGLSLGPAQPLGQCERSFFEARYQADLSAVRVHDNPDTAASAAQLHARAFALGPAIAFGAGEYRPDTGTGRRLLGHELAHVVQATGAAHAHPVLRRQESASQEASPGSDLVCSAETDEPQVCEDTPVPAASAQAGQPAALNLSGSFDERMSAFKQLVKTTAIHRLIGNQRNLDLWAVLIDKVIPATDLASVGMIQSGGLRAYNEMQDIRDPMVRELRAHQAVGRYRACTGCHIENQAWGTRTERSALGGPEWLSPNERRAGLAAPGPFSGTAFPALRWSASPPPDSARAMSDWISGSATVQAPGGAGYQPPAGTLEGRLNQLFPDPADVPRAMKRVRPVLQALGPQGYKVLPDSILTELEGDSVEALRHTIDTAITERKEGYAELIRMIRAGEVGYEHFGPIVRDLLPAADAEVRDAIQQEMDDHAFWAKVEGIVVGLLSIAALLLTIFPPTSAAGLMALGALEAGLGVYGAVKGEEMMRIGQAYLLGIGADDVFTREQQESGGTMVVGGFASVALAPLAVAGGTGRMMGAASRMGEASLESSLALLRAGQTVQRGKYVITVAEDGSLVATVADRPDVLIIMRDGTATAYQSTGSGGMRVLESRTLLPPGAGGASEGGAAFEGGLPHVQQKASNWCGAACGEMAAGRLGVEASQEQIAATRFFEHPVIADGQELSAGGFQTSGLSSAMEEVAPVAGRRWIGGTISNSYPMSTADGLRETMRGFLGSTESSIILRVRGGNHWIVVDEVSAEGMLLIRDPARQASTMVSADELLAMQPTGDAVLSFPRK